MLATSLCVTACQNRAFPISPLGGRDQPSDLLWTEHVFGYRISFERIGGHYRVVFDLPELAGCFLGAISGQSLSLD
jgi:hypothetical protein